MGNSALEMLQDGELCRIMNLDGEREAYWRSSSQMFIFTDNALPAFLRPDQVEEWAPASVKF